MGRIKIEKIRKEPATRKSFAGFFMPLICAASPKSFYPQRIRAILF
jgi:hypothetical protein